MANTKNFILYTIAVSVSIITGVMWIAQEWLKDEWELLPLTSALLAAVCLFLLFLCLNSWLNNFIYYLFFKVKKYSFLSVNFFPIVWIKNNKKKFKISFYPIRLMQIYTKVSLTEIKKEEDCRKFIHLYKSCIRVMFVFSWLLNIVYLLICFHSLWFGLFLLASNMATGYLYMTKASQMQLGGLWEYGTRQGQENHLFCSVCLEQGDKTEIYSGIQKSCPIELESASGREFVIHLLMDCIYEEKNYLTEETEQMLEKLCLPDKSCKLRELPMEYLRVANVYYIYQLEKNDFDVKVRNLVQNSWRIIKEEYEVYQWGEKLFAAISHPEKFDVNDIFEIYREKSCLVYSLYSNLDKLLAS